MNPPAADGPNLTDVHPNSPQNSAWEVPRRYEHAAWVRQGVDMSKKESIDHAKNTEERPSVRRTETKQKEKLGYASTRAQLMVSRTLQTLLFCFSSHSFLDCFTTFDRRMG